MNGKKVANLVFYIVGTFILISIGVVIAINFYKDSRFFESTVTAFKNAAQPSEEEPENESENYETFKYKPTTAGREATGSSGSRAPKPVKPTTSTAVNWQEGSNHLMGQYSNVGKGVYVEVVSYLKEPEIVQKFIDSLRLRGYNVTQYKPASATPYSTRIIERNSKGHGAELYRFMKAGYLIREYRANYRYDVTIILGNDYRP